MGTAHVAIDDAALLLAEAKEREVANDGELELGEVLQAHPVLARGADEGRGRDPRLGLGGEALGGKLGGLLELVVGEPDVAEHGDEVAKANVGEGVLEGALLELLDGVGGTGLLDAIGDVLEADVERTNRLVEREHHLLNRLGKGENQTEEKEVSGGLSTHQKEVRERR